MSRKSHKGYYIKGEFVAAGSEADRSITLRLARALALIDIRLLDHLVVSRNGHVSLAERGWI